MATLLILPALLLLFVAASTEGSVVPVNSSTATYFVVDDERSSLTMTNVTMPSNHSWIILVCPPPTICSGTPLSVMVVNVTVPPYSSVVFSSSLLPNSTSPTVAAVTVWMENVSTAQSSVIGIQGAFQRANISVQGPSTVMFNNGIANGTRPRQLGAPVNIHLNDVSLRDGSQVVLQGLAIGVIWLYGDVFEASDSSSLILMHSTVDGGSASGMTNPRAATVSYGGIRCVTQQLRFLRNSSLNVFNVGFDHGALVVHHVRDVSIMDNSKVSFAGRTTIAAPVVEGQPREQQAAIMFDFNDMFMDFSSNMVVLSIQRNSHLEITDTAVEAGTRAVLVDAAKLSGAFLTISDGSSIAVRRCVIVSAHSQNTILPGGIVLVSLHDSTNVTFIIANGSSVSLQEGNRLEVTNGAAIGINADESKHAMILVSNQSSIYVSDSDVLCRDTDDTALIGGIVISLRGASNGVFWLGLQSSVQFVATLTTVAIAAFPAFLPIHNARTPEANRVDIVHGSAIVVSLEISIRCNMTITHASNVALLGGVLNVHRGIDLVFAYAYATHVRVLAQSTVRLSSAVVLIAQAHAIVLRGTRMINGTVEIGNKSAVGIDGGSRANVINGLLVTISARGCIACRILLYGEGAIGTRDHKQATLFGVAGATTIGVCAAAVAADYDDAVCIGIAAAASTDLVLVIENCRMGVFMDAVVSSQLSLSSDMVGLRMVGAIGASLRVGWSTVGVVGTGGNIVAKGHMVAFRLNNVANTTVTIQDAAVGVLNTTTSAVVESESGCIVFFTMAASQYTVTTLMDGAMIGVDRCSRCVVRGELRSNIVQFNADEAKDVRVLLVSAGSFAIRGGTACHLLSRESARSSSQAALLVTMHRSHRSSFELYNASVAISGNGTIIFSALEDIETLIATPTVAYGVSINVSNSTDCVVRIEHYSFVGVHDGGALSSSWLEASATTTTATTTTTTLAGVFLSADRSMRCLLSVHDLSVFGISGSLTTVNRTGNSSGVLVSMSASINSSIALGDTAGIAVEDNAMLRLESGGSGIAIAAPHTEGFKLTVTDESYIGLQGGAHAVVTSTGSTNGSASSSVEGVAIVVVSLDRAESGTITLFGGGCVGVCFMTKAATTLLLELPILFINTTNGANIAFSISDSSALGMMFVPSVVVVAGCTTTASSTAACPSAVSLILDHTVSMTLDVFNEGVIGIASAVAFTLQHPRSFLSISAQLSYQLAMRCSQNAVVGVKSVVDSFDNGGVTETSFALVAIDTRGATYLSVEISHGGLVGVWHSIVRWGGGLLRWSCNQCDHASIQVVSDDHTPHTRPSIIGASSVSLLQTVNNITPSIFFAWSMSTNCTWNVSGPSACVGVDASRTSPVVGRVALPGSQAVYFNMAFSQRFLCLVTNGGVVGAARFTAPVGTIVNIVAIRSVEGRWWVSGSKSVLGVRESTIYTLQHATSITAAVSLQFSLIVSNGGTIGSRRSNFTRALPSGGVVCGCVMLLFASSSGAALHAHSGSVIGATDSSSLAEEMRGVTIELIYSAMFNVSVSQSLIGMSKSTNTSGGPIAHVVFMTLAGATNGTVALDEGSVLGMTWARRWATMQGSVIVGLYANASRDVSIRLSGSSVIGILLVHTTTTSTTDDGTTEDTTEECTISLLAGGGDMVLIDAAGSTNAELVVSGSSVVGIASLPVPPEQQSSVLRCTLSIAEDALVTVSFQQCIKARVIFESGSVLGIRARNVTAEVMDTKGPSSIQVLLDHSIFSVLHVSNQSVIGIVQPASESGPQENSSTTLSLEVRKRTGRGVPTFPPPPTIHVILASLLNCSYACTMSILTGSVVGASGPLTFVRVPLAINACSVALVVTVVLDPTRVPSSESEALGVSVSFLSGSTLGSANGSALEGAGDGGGAVWIAASTHAASIVSPLAPIRINGTRALVNIIIGGGSAVGARGARSVLWSAGSNRSSGVVLAVQSSLAAPPMSAMWLNGGSVMFQVIENSTMGAMDGGSVSATKSGVEVGVVFREAPSNPSLQTTFSGETPTPPRGGLCPLGQEITFCVLSGGVVGASGPGAFISGGTTAPVIHVYVSLAPNLTGGDSNFHRTALTTVAGEGSAIGAARQGEVTSPTASSVELSHDAVSLEARRPQTFYSSLHVSDHGTIGASGVGSSLAATFRMNNTRGRHVVAVKEFDAVHLRQDAAIGTRLGATLHSVTDMGGVAVHCTRPAGTDLLSVCDILVIDGSIIGARDGGAIHVVNVAIDVALYALAGLTIANGSAIGAQGVGTRIVSRDALAVRLRALQITPLSYVQIQNTSFIGVRDRASAFAAAGFVVVSFRSSEGARATVSLNSGVGLDNVEAARVSCASPSPSMAAAVVFDVAETRGFILLIVAESMLGYRGGNDDAALRFCCGGEVASSSCATANQCTVPSIVLVSAGDSTAFTAVLRDASWCGVKFQGTTAAPSSTDLAQNSTCLDVPRIHRVVEWSASRSVTSLIRLTDLNTHLGLIGDNNHQPPQINLTLSNEGPAVVWFHCNDATSVSLVIRYNASAGVLRSTLRLALLAPSSPSPLDGTTLAVLVHVYAKNSTSCSVTIANGGTLGVVQSNIEVVPTSAVVVLDDTSAYVGVSFAFAKSGLLLVTGAGSLLGVDNSSFRAAAAPPLQPYGNTSGLGVAHLVALRFVGSISSAMEVRLRSTNSGPPLTDSLSEPAGADVRVGVFHTVVGPYCVVSASDGFPSSVVHISVQESTNVTMTGGGGDGSGAVGGGELLVGVQSSNVSVTSLVQPSVLSFDVNRPRAGDTGERAGAITLSEGAALAVRDTVVQFYLLEQKTAPGKLDDTAVFRLRYKTFALSASNEVTLSSSGCLNISSNTIRFVSGRTTNASSSSSANPPAEEALIKLPFRIVLASLPSTRLAVIQGSSPSALLDETSSTAVGAIQYGAHTAVRIGRNTISDVVRSIANETTVLRAFDASVEVPTFPLIAKSFLFVSGAACLVDGQRVCAAVAWFDCNSVGDHPHRSVLNALELHEQLRTTLVPLLFTVLPIVHSHLSDGPLVDLTNPLAVFQAASSANWGQTFAAAVLDNTACPATRTTSASHTPSNSTDAPHGCRSMSAADFIGQIGVAWSTSNASKFGTGGRALLPATIDVADAARLPPRTRLRLDFAVVLNRTDGQHDALADGLRRSVMVMHSSAAMPTGSLVVEAAVCDGGCDSDEAVLTAAVFNLTDSAKPYADVTVTVAIDVGCGDHEPWASLTLVIRLLGRAVPMKEVVGAVGDASSTVGGVTGSFTTASTASRVGPLQRMVSCTNPGAPGGGDGGLLGLSIGDGTLAPSRGSLASAAIVSASAMVIALVAVGGLVWCVPGTSVEEARSVLHLASAVPVLCAVLSPSVVSAAVSLLAMESSSGGDIVLGVVGLLWVGCALAFVGFAMLVTGPRLIRSVPRSGRGEGGAGGGTCTPLVHMWLRTSHRWAGDKSFKDSFLLVLLDVRIMWLIMLDGVGSVLVGVAAGLPGTTASGIGACVTMVVLIVVFFVAQSVTLVMLRPMTSMFMQTYGVLSGVLGTGLGVTVLCALVLRDEADGMRNGPSRVEVGERADAAVSASIVFALLIGGVSLVKSLVDVLTLLAGLHRLVNKFRVRRQNAVTGGGTSGVFETSLTVFNVGGSESSDDPEMLLDEELLACAADPIFLDGSSFARPPQSAGTPSHMSSPTRPPPLPDCSSSSLDDGSSTIPSVGMPQRPLSHLLEAYQMLDRPSQPSPDVHLL